VSRSRWLKRLGSHKLTRDGLLFLAGLAGLIHELFLVKKPQGDVLYVSIVIMAMPGVLRRDDARSEQRDDTRPPPPTSS